MTKSIDSWICYHSIFFEYKYSRSIVSHKHACGFCFFFLTVDVPEKMSYFLDETNRNTSGPARNFICTDDTSTQHNYHIYYKAVIGIFKIQAIKQTVVYKSKETINGSLIEYNCLTLNTDKCVIHNNTYQLRVECE